MLSPMVDNALNSLREEIAKAAEVKTTYTFDPEARSIFSPENLDEEIKYIAPIDTPLRERMPRTEGMGEAAVWKKMTSGLESGTHPGVGATGTSTSVFFADAGAPNETTQTYTTDFAAYKLLGRKLEVGGGALASSKGRAGQPDMQKERERVKIYEVMLGEEEAIIAGDANTTATEFSGLNKQITTNSGNTTFVTYSGVGAWATTLYGQGADPTLLITSARQLQALANNLDSSDSLIRNTVVNGPANTGVVGGFALSQIVNPVTQSLIDVRPSRHVGFGGLLLTEKSAAGQNWLEMEDLISMSRVDVPSGNFSYISFVLEMTALKVISEVYQFKFNTGA